MHAVCDKTFHELPVTEEVPVCLDVDQEICGVHQVTGERVCKTFAKQECTTEERQVVRQVPQVQCRTVPAKVCGPEPCPIASDSICYDEFRQVRIVDDNLGLNLRYMWDFGEGFFY